MSSRDLTLVFSTLDVVSDVLLFSARFSLKIVIGELGSQEIVSSFPVFGGSFLMILRLNGLLIDVFASEFDRTCFYRVISSSCVPWETRGVITET